MELELEAVGDALAGLAEDGRVGVFSVSWLAVGSEDGGARSVALSLAGAPGRDARMTGGTTPGAGAGADVGEFDDDALLDRAMDLGSSRRCSIVRSYSRAAANLSTVSSLGSGSVCWNSEVRCARLTPARLASSDLVIFLASRHWSRRRTTIAVVRRSTPTIPRPRPSRTWRTCRSIGVSSGKLSSRSSCDASTSTSFAASSTRNARRSIQPLTSPRNAAVPMPAKLGGAWPRVQARCRGWTSDEALDRALRNSLLRVSGVSGVFVGRVGSVGRVCWACRACRSWLARDRPTRS